VAGPDTADDARHVHGSAASWAGRGVLLLGPPGSGKSSVLARLLAAGAHLVADDVVRLERRGDALYAGGVAAAGLIELRGNGIFRVTTRGGAVVNLCVELKADPGRERLPERRETTILGVLVPVLRLDGDDPAAVARIMIALAARRMG
jgi:serine kinase of HPr protein (carbohydrate metabolism regulator)